MDPNYDTGKFPNESIPKQFEEDQEINSNFKKLVPLSSRHKDDNFERKRDYQKNYNDIIDYNYEESNDIDARANRLRKQRDRMKKRRNSKESQRERYRMRNSSNEIQQDSEISEIYNNIKNLSNAKRMQYEGLYQNKEERSRNNGMEEKQDLGNFQSFGNRNWEDTSRNHEMLSKRQEVLNRTVLDTQIENQRRLSPKRNRNQVLRKKQSKEELGVKIQQQKEILGLQYRKNQIWGKAEKTFSNRTLDRLMFEISESFRRTGSFTLMDSKRLQKTMFNDFDYYQRKELPALYKLIDVEVELLSKTAY